MVVLYHFVQNVDVLRTYDVQNDNFVALFISADGVVDRDLTRFFLLVCLCVCFFFFPPVGCLFI